MASRRPRRVGNGITAKNSPDLCYRIIEQLEEHDRCPPDFTLYDVVDPDALEQIVASGAEDLQVTFRANGVEVTVTGADTVRLRES